MNIIEIKGLEKKFNFKEKGLFNLKKREFYALNGINLNVKKGDFLGIIGPNGAGKSTLLKLIAGILKPTNGEITVNGDILSFIELGVGMNEELTGRENAFLYGTLLGLLKKYISDNLDSIIDFSGLGSFFDEKIRTYSSGMKIRLAFSIAALCRPEILLVDEILSVGDEEFQEKSMRHIKNLNQHGTTILLVSHDLNKVSGLCNEVAFLNKGKVVFRGNPSEAIHKYYLQISEKSSVDIKKEIMDKMRELEATKREAYKKNENIPSFLDFLKKTDESNLLNISNKEGILLNSVNNKLDLYTSELNLINNSLENNLNSNPIYDLKKRSACLETINLLLSAKLKINKKAETKNHLIENLKETVKNYEKIILYNLVDRQNKISDKSYSRKILEENEDIKFRILDTYKQLDGYLDKKSMPHESKRYSFGSKEAVIKSVKLYSKKNILTNRFHLGGYFRADIEYECKARIQKPMIGIAIHTKEGILVTGPNTTFSNYILPYIQGRGKISFIIEALPLLEGEYDLSASIYDFMGEKPIDHHYRLYHFSVFNEGNPEKYGVVHIDHSWRISTKE